MSGSTLRWFGDSTLLSAPAAALLAEALRGSGATGAVVVLVRGERRLIACHGVARAGAGEAVTPQHAFAVASLAKAVTAFAAAKLAAQGVIDLDAPVAALLPTLRLPTAQHTREVTLRHVLANASGLGPVWPLDEMLGRAVPLAEVLSRMHALPVIAPPGQRFAYLNLGFVAAAAALSQASGLTFDRLVHEQVFAPLGMTHSAAWPGWAAMPAPGLVAGHDGGYRISHGGHGGHGNTPVRVLDTTGYDNHPGAGWMAMSAYDAARWMRAWLDTEAPPWHVHLREPQVAVDPSDTGLWLAPPGEAAQYGWGWGHSRYRGRALLQHSGASIGGTAHITLMRSESLGLATFLSGGRLYRAALHYALLDHLLGAADGQQPEQWLEQGEAALAAVERTDQPTAADAAAAPLPLAHCTGAWHGPGCGVARISAANDDTLWLDFDKAPQWRCRLNRCAARAWATELIEPNDGLRFMAAQPIGRFVTHAEHGLCFVHPFIETLYRRAA